jgi:hypothetical protein
MDVSGRCLSAIISPVHNMTRLWDAPALHVRLIRMTYPLVKIESPDWYTRLWVRADQIINFYSNWDFGMSRLLSLFKSSFLLSRAFPALLLLMISVLVLLRCLPFVLVTVNCTSTDTCTSTSPTTRNCTSATCRLIKNKLRSFSLPENYTDRATAACRRS